MEVEGELNALDHFYHFGSFYQIDDSFALGVQLPHEVSASEYICQLDCEFRLLVKNYCNGCRRKKANKNVICHCECTISKTQFRSTLAKSCFQCS